MRIGKHHQAQAVRCVVRRVAYFAPADAPRRFVERFDFFARINGAVVPCPQRDIQLGMLAAPSFAHVVFNGLPPAGFVFGFGRRFDHAACIGLNYISRTFGFLFLDEVRLGRHFGFRPCGRLQGQQYSRRQCTVDMFIFEFHVFTSEGCFWDLLRKQPACFSGQ